MPHERTVSSAYVIQFISRDCNDEQDDQQFTNPWLTKRMWYQTLQSRQQSKTSSKSI